MRVVILSVTFITHLADFEEVVGVAGAFVYMVKVIKMTVAISKMDATFEG